MEISDRATAMLDLLKQGMDKANDSTTSVTLGDRQTYIGLSDLAKFSQCQRAAVANRVLPRTDSFAQSLVFSRGHWIEAGLGESLGHVVGPMMQQLEIAASINGRPVKAHLDFVLLSPTPTPAIRIVECKSMANIPAEPYPEHVFQAQSQVSMLYEFWNEPVFSLHNSMGTNAELVAVTFPQLCRTLFGIAMPDDPVKVDMEAWLLCVSMKEAHPYGPYIFDRATVDGVFDLANAFWQHLDMVRKDASTLKDVPIMEHFSPLCCVCQHNGDCPRFSGTDNMPELEATIQKLNDLKGQKSECEAAIKALDDALRTSYNLSGAKGWLGAGGYRLKVTQMPGRKSLNKDLLERELSEVFEAAGVEQNVSDLFASCEREGAGYTRLNISTVNSASAA